ncbi:MAG: dolichol kinase [Ignavibacteriae bacterium]|nr:dolichol kinase [Ignavibacteriota bacterium]
MLAGIESSYHIELVRKAIHLCSLSIPIFYFFTPKNVALAVFIPLTIAFLVVDVARYYHKPIESWFYTWFGWLLRRRESDREKKRLNGATYVLISATLAIIIFPKFIAVTSFIILIISDLTAALVGRRFGKHKFFEKTLEGSLGFFLSALLVVFLTPKIEYYVGEYLIGALAAAIGTIVEALPIDVDDNLSVPLSVGGILWAAYSIVYPMLNVYKFG